MLYILPPEFLAIGLATRPRPIIWRFVLAAIMWRGAEKMDDCANCEFLEKCREGARVPCPWETVEIVHNPNI